MSRVICAFGGTGKTTLAKKDSRFVDIENSDYMWIYDTLIEDAELRKGSSKKINPEFPKNYINAVSKALEDGYFVLTGSKPEVLQALTAADIEFLLVLPQEDDKEEYKQRFIFRGNTSTWYDAYLSGWNDRFAWYTKIGYTTLTMSSHSFLEDYVGTLVNYLTSPLVLSRNERISKDSVWVEFCNTITDCMNTYLHEDMIEFIKKSGRDYGAYILYDRDFCFRVPGCTCGGIEVDDKGIIKSFHVNDGYPFGMFNLDTPEVLKGILEEKFVGTKIELPESLNYLYE